MLFTSSIRPHPSALLAAACAPGTETSLFSSTAFIFQTPSANGNHLTKNDKRIILLAFS